MTRQQPTPTVLAIVEHLDDMDELKQPFSQMLYDQLAILRARKKSLVDNGLGQSSNDFDDRIVEVDKDTAAIIKIIKNFGFLMAPLARAIRLVEELQGVPAGERRY